MFAYNVKLFFREPLANKFSNLSFDIDSRSHETY